MADTISEQVLQDNVRARTSGDVRSRLQDAGYMSPQGKPFRCGSCDFFDGLTHYCSHPKVQAVVEKTGCCNFLTIDGVSNTGA